MKNTITITVEVDVDDDQLYTKQYDALYAHAYAAMRTALDDSGIDYSLFRVRMHRTENLVLTDKQLA